MFAEFLFIPAIAVILYGLIRSTDKILARRAQPVEKDVRMIDHRSRM
jgi:hypothetical protein